MNSDSTIQQVVMNETPIMVGKMQVQDEEEAKKRFINKPMIPIRIVLFFWYAAAACLLPYMTLHMKQLGLTMLETTAVYATLPIIQLFGGPITGFIADKTGNYRPVLLLTLSTCIVTTLLLNHIVPARKARDPSASGADSDEAAASEALYMVTFWLYLAIRIVHQVSVGVTYTLLDTTAVILGERNKSDFGQQRFWAIFSTGVFSPIAGYVIDHMSYTEDEYGQKIQNYNAAFYLFSMFTALTLYKASKIEILMKTDESSMKFLTKIRSLLKSGNMWMFLFSVFMMGSCWGFIESFLFLHLQKLAAPNYLLGLTATVGSFIGLPFLYNANWIIEKIGIIRTLILALVFYFIRLVGYSYLENPWYCLVYELMEAFTLHLMWVATVNLAYAIAPPGLSAFFQAVVGALNFGIGRGFGSFVGGSVIVLYGERVAFRTVGVMALSAATFYAIMHFFFLPPLEVHNNKANNNNNANNANNNGCHMDSEAGQVACGGGGCGKRRRQTSKDVEQNHEETITAAAS